MKRPTRFYSNKQEKRVAKAVDGKQTVNSGATPFQKGDVNTDLFLIECKTATTEKKSFSIKREWIDKNDEEAFAMDKPFSALAIDFGDGTNYYVINEKLFKRLIGYIREEINNGR